MKEWLKYRSDRVAFEFIVNFAAIFIACDVGVILLDAGPARDIMLFGAGASAVSFFFALAQKKQRRFWNDRYGRDIWYSDER